MDDRILVTNIQRFSLHDGPGIRTTAFLKGCSLRCPWCANPETQEREPETYMKDGAEHVYGKWYTAEELFRELVKDRAFYGSGPGVSRDALSADGIDSLPGGVTFSGGEPLLQMKKLVPLCEKLKSEDIHIAAETCLFVTEEDLAAAVSYVDFFYVDVKIPDPVRCRSILRGDIELYLKNLETLLQAEHAGGGPVPVVLRVPVIGTYTDSPENRRAGRGIIRHCGKRILKVELLPEHNLGMEKYLSLGRSSSYHGVGQDLMETYARELADTGVPVEILPVL